VVITAPGVLRRGLFYFAGPTPKIAVYGTTLGWNAGTDVSQALPRHQGCDLLVG